MSGAALDTALQGLREGEGSKCGPGRGLWGEGLACRVSQDTLRTRMMLV